ncbi:MAG: hypothetical protein ABSG65_18645 [Bryobacteraceae bacterium]|jgi:hypothetical protein
MATEKQIAANRRNALKSTGPRTPRGKAFTRLNALRHGLRAAAGTPLGEDLKELTQIRNQFMMRCQPQTAEQVHFLEQMATSRWLWLHWQRTEARVLSKASTKGPASQIAILDRLSVRQASYERAYMKAYRQYQRSSA